MAKSLTASAKSLREGMAADEHTHTHTHKDSLWTTNEAKEMKH